MLDNTFWAEKPEKVRKGVALIDGVLHISEELKGNREMVNLVAELRRYGIVDFEFHKPSDFDEHYARFSTRCVSNGNEIQVMATSLIERAYKNDSTDIHLTDLGNYLRVQFRTLGMLCEHTQMEGETGRWLLQCIYNNLCDSTDSESFSNLKQHDGRITNRDLLPLGMHSVRVHAEPEDQVASASGTGTFMTLRLLYDSTAATGTLEQRMTVMGFLHVHIETTYSLTQRDGMVVISGPTGHGKTTFLNHVVTSMTIESPERAYVAVEDPPEYPMRDVHRLKVVTNEALGNSRARGDAYINKIAGAMRCDTDVLIIGEIRYPAAALSAMDAAMSGHPTWTTIHANNAFGVIPRMEGMLRQENIRDPLNALCNPNVLSGLTYQRLIAKLCPKCKRLYGSLSEERRKEAIPKNILESLKHVLDWEEIMSKVFVRGEGCEHCKKMGLSGQTVVAEVVELDMEMLSLLRDGKMYEAHKIWHDKGNPTYIEHAIELLRQGIIDPVTARIRLGVPLNYNKWFEPGPVR
ncbi:MAG: Flp pilus assembly complex ATPase component TadA [Desulfovibrio sp.]|jgi:type II secretory ATPase GspE/PulE/Tfp pilus assembly ATPase PilB-like protein|nr:Flp pilus assembly complex ATPase component TadA [Desulfovibrio sp.]